MILYSQFNGNYPESPGRGSEVCGDSLPAPSKANTWKQYMVDAFRPLVMLHELFDDVLYLKVSVCGVQHACTSAKVAAPAVLAAEPANVHLA